ATAGASSASAPSSTVKRDPEGALPHQPDFAQGALIGNLRPSSRYIGGNWPCRPTLTRAAVRLPSGWRCAFTKTLAPSLSSLRSAGVKDTITAFSGTSTFFSPPLYCTVRTRSLPMLVTLATFALVILLVGLNSPSY